MSVQAHNPTVCVALATMLMCAAVSGCKTSPVAIEPRNTGEVGVAIVPPASGTKQLELPASQAFVFPNLIEPVAVPDYPPALLPMRLGPVEICVEAQIDAQGIVFAARARDDGACAAGDAIERAVFAQAGIAAVRQWRYDPAYLCVAPEGAIGDPCMHPEVREQPTPIQLSYVFRFTQRDGSPTVERVSGASGSGD